jgi:transcriptional regulator with XRE-family HTH domain
MKTRERLQARELRRHEGLSIKEIARVLHVSQSSVSTWVRDVQLTPAQLETLAARNPALNPAFSGSRERAARALADRLRWQAEGRELARRADPAFAAGCMLYWAEGSRRRNAVAFTNSDPEMMVFFVRFLRRFFAVGDDLMRVWCNLFADHLVRQREVEQFWLDALGLPRSVLYRSTVNAHSSRSKRLRSNRLPYGTCRVIVYRTRVAQAIYGAIQELGGFEREEWATM